MVPIDRVDDAVDVLLELPRKTALADAALADDRHEPRLLLALSRMEKVLEQPQLLVAAGERRLERLASAGPAAQPDDGCGAPRRNGRRLALEHLLAGLLEPDRALRSMESCLTHEHGARRSHRLKAARRVDQIACDHPLPARSQGHSGVPGEHSRACLGVARIADARHAVDQLERGTHRTLSVILVRRRRAPHGHDCVTDELLDRAAVAVHDGPGQLEVARQELARVLRILVLATSW